MGSSVPPNVGGALDTVKMVGGPIMSYTGELTQELDRYREYGRAEAAQHRPPSDARGLDKHESQLQTDAAKHLAVQRNFLDHELQQAVTAFNSLEQRLIQWHTKCEMALSEGQFTLAVDAELSQHRDHLVGLTESRMRSDVSLRAFKARHGIPLDEDARYPEHVFMHFGIIAILAVIETIVNAFFYQNDQGLLGGLVIALSVSALNLGMAIALGWASRYRNLRETDKRIGGWFALLFFGFWVLFSNALFAAFRGEYPLIDPSNSAQLAAAFTRSMQNASGVFSLRLHLSDFQSFILFGLGILLSLFAFWKGLSSDDKYPGHSRLDRVSRRDRAAERSEFEEVGKRIKSFLARKQAELQGLLTEPQMIIAEAVGRSSALSQAGALYEARQQAIRRDFEMVLTTYRNANVSIRATDPPQYFTSLPALSIADTGSVFAQTMHNLERLKGEAASARAKFDAPVQARVNQFLADSRTAIADGLAVYRDSITAEATERINQDLQTVARIPQ